MSEKRKVRGSIDRLLEVVKVADQAHEGGHESVPGTGDPRHEAVLPELCIARGGRQQGRRDPRARRDSPAFGERGRSKGVKWRRERVVEQFVHDAQGRHSAPVPQRLQLNAFGVPEDASGSDLDPVQTREGCGWSAEPQRAAILQLGAHEGLVDRSQTFVSEHWAGSAQQR